MTIEENKRFVTQTWQRLLGGDVEGALVNFSDDVTWFLTGKLEGVSGLKKGKEAVREFLGGVRQAFFSISPPNPEYGPLAGGRCPSSRVMFKVATFLCRNPAWLATKSI